MNKKRLTALALALCMLVTVFAGCATGSMEMPDYAQDTDGNKAPVVADATKASIVVATWDGGLGSQWLENAAKEFEELHKDSVFEEGKTGVDIVISASRNYDGSSMAYTDLQQDVYFVEAIDYYAMVNYGKMLDVTDIITEPLTEYGEDGTILDKIDPALQEFMNIDGAYYAIPFYETFYSFAYDLDLWDERSFYISSSGGWTDASGSLSNGPDGVAGTYDDGMPATYADFNKLISHMRDVGVTPFLYPDNGKEYISNLMFEYWANYEGLEQMMLNYTFDGVATDLITVAADGTVTKLPETAITFENGYDLQRQAGKYYVLDFFQNVLYANKDNYKMTDTHTNAHYAYVSGGITSEKIYGMLIDGTWWENEAKPAFANLPEGERHNYAVMPMPHASADKIGQKPTWLAMSSSYGFIGENCKNVELAKEFMRFLHTDAQLSAFTGETNMTRALIYDILPADQEKLSTYAQSILELKANSDVIYPYSNIPEVIDNFILFGAFSWAWKTRIGGMEEKNPWEYFKNTSGASAISYFAGQYDFFKKSWEGI